MQLNLVIIGQRSTVSYLLCNGIIFCAQLFEVVDIPQSIYDISSTIIKAFLLFKVDHPQCFYDGMTEIWRSGITLLYPVYLLSILLVLASISRFSVKISNQISGSSIQVLVTVVHLSFSVLKVTIVNNRCIYTYQYIHKHK